LILRRKRLCRDPVEDLAAAASVEAAPAAEDLAEAASEEALITDRRTIITDGILEDLAFISVLVITAEADASAVLSVC